MTFATTDALVMVNVRLAVLVIVDGVLGTVCVARARNTTAAQVRHLIVNLYAR